MDRKLTEEMTEFIVSSPTAYHSVDSFCERLKKDGFLGLSENEDFQIVPGGKYYVTRNRSSLIAFKVGVECETIRFHIAASHCDFPTFKLKENAALAFGSHYTRLNTEGYGGPEGINVFACFDNEEVGSETKQGAASTFLRDILVRICQKLGNGERII